MAIEAEATLTCPIRTHYRHRQAILSRLKVSAWGAEGRALAQATMCKTARARTDLAEIMNSAIDALIRHDFELPPLATLRRLAGTWHSKSNAAQWDEVCGRLSSAQHALLETLLVVDPKTQKSPFANLCATPGRPSRKNLNALVDRYLWLQGLPNSATALESIPDSKISQWANEAKRLNALELREYITPRRHTLLMAVIHDARGQVLDGLTKMLLRLARKVEWKSELRLTEWYQTRRNKTDALIRAFRDSLVVHGSDVDPMEKVSLAQALFTAQGGHHALVQSCDEHLQHEKQNWRPFARAMFVPLRSALVQLVEILPLQSTADSDGLLCVAKALKSDASQSDYLSIAGVAPNTLPREWHALVHDHASDTRVFNRRQLEVVAILELANAIKAGEVFVTGSLNFDRFWDRLPFEAADSAAVAAYATSRGWTDGADGLVRAVKKSLDQKAHFLDVAVGTGQQAYIRRGRHGRPVVSRLQAVGTPATAVDLENQLMAHMPERAVLEAIC